MSEACGLTWGDWRRCRHIPSSSGGGYWWRMRSPCPGPEAGAGGWGRDRPSDRAAAPAGTCRGERGAPCLELEHKANIIRSSQFHAHCENSLHSSNNKYRGCCPYAEVARSQYRLHGPELSSFLYFYKLRQHTLGGGGQEPVRFLKCHLWCIIILIRSRKVSTCSRYSLGMEGSQKDYSLYAFDNVDITASGCYTLIQDIHQPNKNW